MTIEKEFFKAFNYKPQIIVKYELDDGIFELPHGKYMDLTDRSPINGKYVTYISQRNEYPTITPEIVLEFAAILNDIVFLKIECCCLFTGKTVEEITNNILNDCIDHKDEIQDQVRELFNAM